MVKAAILGASGYTGGELLRLLYIHPDVEVVYASSREYRGKPLHYAHPGLHGLYSGLRFEELNTDKASRADVVFNALPHGAGVEYTAQLYDMGLLVVDLSADYRLKNPALYEEWYGWSHPRRDLLEKAVYGLPELHRDEIRNTRLIASPGCNATAAILASAPLAAAGLLGETVVADVKTGSSEGGSKPSRGSHHPEREGSIRPYNPGGHRHQAELSQELSRLAEMEVRASLVPHVVPAVRGALASVHTFRDGVDSGEVLRAYAGFYRGEPFIRLAKFSPPGYPDVKSVIGSNYADVGYAVDIHTGRITGFAAIDNLVKGAAGQAVQAMNIALGLPETRGLEAPPLRP